MTTGNLPPELAAINTIYNILLPLEESPRKRVLNYIIDMLEIATELTGSSGSPEADVPDPEPNSRAIAAEQAKAPKYGTLAELFDAAGPNSNVDKALIGGYWLQVCMGQENFDGLSVNRNLKDLGHGLPNVTNAIAALRNQKPALALQLRKSGSSQQARKTYKITEAGIRKVEEMIGG